MFVSSGLLPGVSMPKPSWNLCSVKNLNRTIHGSDMQRVVALIRHHHYITLHPVVYRIHCVLQSGNLPQPIISGHCGIRAFWHSCSFEFSVINCGKSISNMQSSPYSHVMLFSDWVSIYDLGLIFPFDIIWRCSSTQINDTIHKGCCSNINIHSLPWAPVHAEKSSTPPPPTWPRPWIIYQKSCCVRQIVITPVLK